MRGNPRTPEFLGPEVFSNTSSTLHVLEENAFPFPVRRIYWLTTGKEASIRGGHCHENSDRILICMCGSANVTLTDKEGNDKVFLLNDPSRVLYFPRNYWIDLEMSPNTSVLAAASTLHSEDIIIRDFNVFRGIDR